MVLISKSLFSELREKVESHIASREYYCCCCSRSNPSYGTNASIVLWGECLQVLLLLGSEDVNSNIADNSIDPLTYIFFLREKLVCTEFLVLLWADILHISNCDGVSTAAFPEGSTVKGNNPYMPSSSLYSKNSFIVKVLASIFNVYRLISNILKGGNRNVFGSESEYIQFVLSIIADLRKVYCDNVKST